MIDARAVSRYVDQNFPSFGLNKSNQISRLLYEIAKREGIDVPTILPQAGGTADFHALKKYLLRRRFPSLAERESSRLVFSELAIDPANRIDIRTPRAVGPKRFIIEKSVKDTPLVRRLYEQFPHAWFEMMASYKDHARQRKPSIRDYNNRWETFYVIRENYDFYKPCPCSVRSVSCGYHVVNLGSGCAFECSYCFLQDYLNEPGMVIPANIEDFFAAFRAYKKDIRLGSAELTDSLIFDHITQFSSLIVEFFKHYPQSRFEFKTKSNNIQNLLTVTPADNIVVSWSMNPPKIVDTTEFYTASVQERLAAALRCMEAGYRLAFHFDPMIYYEGWETDYHDLVDMIFSRIDLDRLEWVSLGTLRLTPRLRKIIENRFPDNAILDAEFVNGYDGKYRYPFGVRTRMYQKMKEWILDYKPDVYLYLCMEEKEACACAATPLRRYQTVREGARSGEPLY